MAIQSKTERPGMCGGSRMEACCTPTTTHNQQPHATGSSLKKEKIIYHLEHQDH